MILTTTERFVSAMAYAHQVHQGQRRKGTGIPYIAHVLGVAAIAMEYGADVCNLYFDAGDEVADHRHRRIDENGSTEPREGQAPLRCDRQQ